MFEIALTGVLVLGILSLADYLTENMTRLRSALLVGSTAITVVGVAQNSFAICFVGLVILAVAATMYLD